LQRRNPFLDLFRL
jgi:hypothetical protein